MANCDNRCPVFCQIEQIRAKCLACKVCEDGNTLQCGGGGAIHADAAANPELVYQKAKAHIATPSVGVTKLPLEIEDALRQLFSTFLGMDEISQLLLVHLANGGNLANFQDRLRSLFGQLQEITAKKPKTVKAFAWARFKTAVNAFKPFAAIAGGLIGKGKGGAVKGSRGASKYQDEFDFGED